MSYFEPKATARLCRARAGGRVDVDRRSLQAAHESRLHQFLRRQRDRELHAGLPQSLRQLSRRPGGGRRPVLLSAHPPAGRDRRQRKIAHPRVRPGVRVRAVDGWSCVHDVSRLGFVRSTQDLLHAVRGHVCCGGGALHHFRWSHDVSYDHAASPRPSRPADPFLQPGRTRSRAALHRRSGIGHRVLPE